MMRLLILILTIWVMNKSIRVIIITISAVTDAIRVTTTTQMVLMMVAIIMMIIILITLVVVVERIVMMVMVVVGVDDVI